MLHRVGAGGAAGKRLSLGAVVIPTNRDLTRGEQAGIDLGAHLALRMNCPLLILCSGSARSVDVPARVRRALGSQLVVRDIGIETTRLRRLESTHGWLCRIQRSNDAGAKRNLGLAAARLAGWPTVLFLDDDISPEDDGPTLNEGGLKSALGAMRSEPFLRAVGWTLEKFQDNSVLGHARRLAGEDQDIFISSGALLVRCDSRTPFFPGVYNEDWLFLIACAQASPVYSRCLGWAGHVRQRPYEPFRRERARSEEPGEMLAEGLMNLLEEDGPGLWAEATMLPFWSKVKDGREALLRDVICRLDGPDRSGGCPADQRKSAVRALQAALELHRKVTPEALRDYAIEWRADLDRWRQYTDQLNGEGPLPLTRVMPRLGLDPAALKRGVEPVRAASPRLLPAAP